jgi:hypothetical protein
MYVKSNITFPLPFSANKAIFVLLSSVCFVYGCNSGPCGPGRLCRRSTQEKSEDTHELRLAMVNILNHSGRNYLYNCISICYRHFLKVDIL